MLNIYYGRENIDKEKFIIEKIGQRNTQKTLIIVPDQYTLEAEQQVFKQLGVEALMDIEVLSMSRLGSRLLSELGGQKQTFIDKYGRHMILHRIAKKHREELQVFRGLEGKNSFIEMVNNFISEMKQYNCGLEEMQEIIKETEEGSYTQRKMQDLALIYGKYEEEIKDKYTDSEDYIDLYLNKISASEFIKGSQVWVYGFDSFAPKSLQVIGQLVAAAEEVNVVVTWDSGCRDEELFELTGLVMYNLEKTADSAGVECLRHSMDQMAAGRLAQAPAIAHIQQELYTLPVRKSKKHDGITLVSAAGLYNEAESAAAYVLHLVRDKGLRYKDIRIICNDAENRGPIIERVFQEYGMQVFSDSKRDILSSPVIQHVLALMETVIYNYRSEDVFRGLKSGLSEMNMEDITDLENYAIKYRIRRNMWKKPFQKGQTEYGDGLARIEELRQTAVVPLLRLEDLAKRESITTGIFIEGFYKYLYEDICLPEKILAFISRQEELGRIDLADETEQIWASLVGILDQISEIIGGEPFEAEEFLDLLKTGLSQVEIGVLPPTKDGLLMGTMQRSRFSSVKALVVIGANEGILPQDSPAKRLFATEEKELFREKGTEICKVDSIVLMEEKLAIYRNMSKPSEYLWMSFSAADGEGKETKPSSVFVRLQEIFPELKVEKDVISQGSYMQMIHGGMGSLKHLTESMQEVTTGGSMAREWAQTLEWFKANQPEKLNGIREGFAFTNSQEELGKLAAKALFMKDPEGAVSVSPSRLEKFSRCPFSHFIAYGLRPEERRIFEIAPREIGDIYHECLMTLTRALTRDDLDVTHPMSPWMTVTRQQCDQLVRETAKAQMELYKEGLFKLGKVENYRSERIYEICQQVCWAVVEQVRAGQIVKNSFEASFRRGGEIKPIKIDAGGETVYIEGKIDRVDYLPDNRVKIIDYKTGNETFSVTEAKEGYRLQLMLYLKAACEGSQLGQDGPQGGPQKGKPAGVFYFHITEPMINMTDKEVDMETLEHEIQKNFKLNGVMVDEPGVIESIAGDFSGFSEIVPLRANKDGSIKGTGKENLLSEEDFAQLQEAVTEKVTEICRDFVEGKIDIHPMKTKTRSACTYCEYKGICRFDTAFDGCEYNVIS